jgi:hypothetical protein
VTAADLDTVGPSEDVFVTAAELDNDGPMEDVFVTAADFEEDGSNDILPEEDGHTDPVFEINGVFELLIDDVEERLSMDDGVNDGEPLCDFVRADDLE